LATFVMRGKEYLVAIVAENGILRAETLRFADEVRSPSDVGLPERVDVEASLVKKLGGEIKKHVKPSLSMAELEDDYEEGLEKLVEQKARRRENLALTSEHAEQETQGAEVIDLMEILKQSLGEGSKPARGRARATRSSTPARPRRARPPAKRAVSSRRSGPRGKSGGSATRRPATRKRAAASR
jgi:DNA end-binding protein Ku